MVVRQLPRSIRRPLALLLIVARPLARFFGTDKRNPAELYRKMLEHDLYRGPFTSILCMHEEHFEEVLQMNSSVSTHWRLVYIQDDMLSTFEKVVLACERTGSNGKARKK